MAYQDHGADRDMYLLKRGKDGVVAALEEGDSDSPLLPHLRPNPFLQVGRERRTGMSLAGLVVGWLVGRSVG